MSEAVVARPRQSKSREEAMKLRKRAKEHMQQMLKLAQTARVSTMEIAYIGWRMKKDEEFAVLGMEEEDFRNRLHIERSTWYHNLQTAGGLEKLPKREFLQLASGKAFLLATQLSESERYKPEWLKRATDPEVTESALEEMIRAAKAEGEVVDDATVAEPRTKLTIRCYESQKQVIEQKLKEFCAAHSMGDDFGRALELILVEKSGDRPSLLLKVISEHIPTIKGVVSLIRKEEDECPRCKAVRGAVEPFILDLGKAAGLK